MLDGPVPGKIVVRQRVDVADGRLSGSTLRYARRDQPQRRDAAAHELPAAFRVTCSIALIEV